MHRPGAVRLIGAGVVSGHKGCPTAIPETVEKGDEMEAYPWPPRRPSPSPLQGVVRYDLFKPEDSIPEAAHMSASLKP